MRLKYDEALSNFAFNYKLRRYGTVTGKSLAFLYGSDALAKEADLRVGTDVYCSPCHRMLARHRMPFKSRNEGLNCV